LNRVLLGRENAGRIEIEFALYMKSSEYCTDEKRNDAKNI